MSGDFDLPGDPGEIKSAAGHFQSMATDLHGRAGGAQGALSTAVSAWTAPRADDFEHVATTVVDEVALASGAMSEVSGHLSTYASKLSDLKDDMKKLAHEAERVEQEAHQHHKKGENQSITTSTGCYTSPEAAMEGLRDAADDIRRDAKELSRGLAGQLAGAVDTAVPGGSSASGGDLSRKVSQAMGTYHSDLKTNGDAWKMFKAVDDEVFKNAPKVNSKAFAPWFRKLSPLQRQLALQNLGGQFDSSDFNPFDSIAPGRLPQWAQDLNASFRVCSPGNPEGKQFYGIFGGGTIKGPGGVPWPIAMPFYRDKDGRYYMADDGEVPANGGIQSLDGHDPGWVSVSGYRGLNKFGSVSGITKIAAATVKGGGSELKFTANDPGAITVDDDGRPTAGRDARNGNPEKPLSGPTVKPLSAPWNYDRPGNAATVVNRGLEAAQAVKNLDTHSARQWYVDYQVNERDGRHRAIVHTYTAGTSDKDPDKTIVGSFANSFPSGSDTTDEISYNTRHHEYSHATATAAPDPDVSYTGRDNVEENQDIYHEKTRK